MAGIDLNTGAWVRPVRDSGGALTVGDISYEDKTIPSVLDIIDVLVLARQPLYYQPENWVIDPEWYWKKVSKYNDVSLLSIYCFHGPCLFAGNNDRLSEYEARSMVDPHSLVLIKVTEICLEKRWPVVGMYPQLRAKFIHNQLFYDLAVTDVLFVEKFKGKTVDIGKYFYKGKFLLTISLGEPFMGNHYKLVASIINLDMTETSI